MRGINNKPIILVILLIIAIIAIGTVGFMISEHYSFLDAVYVTVSVITTLGLDASHSFSNGGKIFTIFMSLSGATMFIFAAGFLADWFFSRVTKRTPNEMPEKSQNIDLFNSNESKDVRIAVVKVPSSMVKADILERFGVVILAIEKGNGFYDVNVPFSAQLKKGSSVVIMGTEEQINGFSKPQ
jgi:hypothetical protein